MHFSYVDILFKQCPDDLIKSAPFENVTVPLGQITPVNFSCNADGDFVLWAINGTYHHLNDPNIYQNRITFYPDVHTSSGSNISMGINVTTATNNNTEIHCTAAIVGETAENSTTVTLTIAGKIIIGIRILIIHRQIVLLSRSASSTSSRVSCCECHSH